MAEDGLGPDDLTAGSLPTARRGYDRKAVDDLLREASRAWAQSEERYRRLIGEIEARGSLENLGRDLREIGEQVGGLLGDAQETAEAMRARASDQVAERLAEAARRAADLIAEAERQAFRLRSDAWETGVELLEQTRAAADAMIEQAEAEVLIIRAAAEQDAHRRIADARREAGEITRTARFEGERTVGEARRLADRLVADARREAGEAETVVEPPVAGPDWAVKVVGGEADEGRSAADADPHHPSYGDALADEVASLRATEEALPPEQPPAEEAAVPGPEAPALAVVSEPEIPRAVVGSPAVAPPEDVEPVPGREVGEAHVGGEADRAANEEVPSPEPPSDHERRRGVPEGTVSGQILAVDTVSGAEAEAEPESIEEPPSEGREPEVSGLFERLRRGREPDAGSAGEVEEEREERAVPEEPEPRLAPTGTRPEPLELRDRLLLPMINEGARAVRARLVEMQNVGLDTVRMLRRGAVWEPDPDAIETEMVESLAPMLEQSADAGVAAAAEICGGEAAPAPAPSRGPVLLRGMAERLAEDLARATSLGGDQRASVAEVSRVFRAWRNDQVDRWVRAVAYSGYHEGLLAGLAAGGVEEVAGVRHGRLCSRCPAGSGAPWHPSAEPPPGTVVPPADVDCTCAITPHP